MPGGQTTVPDTFVFPVDIRKTKFNDSHSHHQAVYNQSDFYLTNRVQSFRTSRFFSALPTATIIPMHPKETSIVQKSLEVVESD